jgi:acyl-CoA thioester hydrolase
MPGDASDRPYAGRFENGEHRFAVRVYYEDTDAGGVVYHANYLRFFERARTDMLALFGADLARALSSGEGGYVVTEAQLKFLAPAKLGDALIVASTIVQLRSASCVVQQRVMRDGQGIAEGRITVAFVGADGRPRRQPASWIEAFRAVQKGD